MNIRLFVTTPVTGSDLMVVADTVAGLVTDEPLAGVGLPAFATTISVGVGDCFGVTVADGAGVEVGGKEFGP